MQDTEWWCTVIMFEDIKSVYWRLYTKKLNSWLVTQLYYAHVVERLDKEADHSRAEQRFRWKKNRNGA